MIGQSMSCKAENGRLHGGILGKAEPHMHSTSSDGRVTVAAILDYAEYETPLDIISITDHDCLDGALLAQELLARRAMRIQFFLRDELTTRLGNFMAFNTERI